MGYLHTEHDPLAFVGSAFDFSLFDDVRPEKYQFLEIGQNCNFDYKIVISVKNPEFNF